MAPFPASRPATGRLAAIAATAEEEAAGGAPLNVRFVVLFLGLRGSGKTATINRLLGLEDDSDPFNGGTDEIRVIDGECHGISLRCIDTPGLELGLDAEPANKRKLSGTHRLACSPIPGQLTNASLLAHTCRKVHG